MNQILHDSVRVEFGKLVWKIEKPHSDLIATWLALACVQLFFAIFAFAGNWVVMEYFGIAMFAYASLVMVNLGFATFTDQYEEIERVGPKLRIKLSYPFFLLKRDAKVPIAMQNLIFIRQTRRLNAANITAVNTRATETSHLALVLHFQDGNCLPIVKGCATDIVEIVRELSAILETVCPNPQPGLKVQKRSD